MFILNLKQKNLIFLRHFKNSLPAHLQEMAPKYLLHPLYYWQSLNILSQSNTRHHRVDKNVFFSIGVIQTLVFPVLALQELKLKIFVSFLITSKCLFKVPRREQRMPFSKACDSQNMNEPETLGNTWHFLSLHNSYHSVIYTCFFLGGGCSCFLVLRNKKNPTKKKTKKPPKTCIYQVK